MIEPGLYVGSVMHRRLRPRLHRFEYKVFWLLLDLDRLEETARALKLLSIDRFNLFSFYARDHADGRDGPLRSRVASLAAKAGFATGGPLTLFTMPRVLGYVFNPLSVYFCHDTLGRPTAIVWEVSSTFGERHSYVIGVDDPDARIHRQRCHKELHVSPLIGMEIEYRFRVAADGDLLSLGIADHDADGLLMSAALTARRRPLSDAELMKAFARIPFETLKVTAAIHWQALRLWRKGAVFIGAPPVRSKSIDRHSASVGEGAQSRGALCEAKADERKERGGRENIEFEQPLELIRRQLVKRRAREFLRGDECDEDESDEPARPPRFARPKGKRRDEPAGKKEEGGPGASAKHLGRHQTVENPDGRRRDARGERRPPGENGCRGIKRRSDQRNERRLEAAAHEPPDRERIEGLVGDHHPCDRDAGRGQRIEGAFR